MKKNGIKIKYMSAFAGIATFMLMTNLFQINAMYKYPVYALIRGVSAAVAALFVLFNMTSAVKGTYVMRFRFRAATVLMVLYTVSRLYSNHIAGTLSAAGFLSNFDVLLLFVVLDLASNKNLLRAALLGMAVYFVIICAVNDIVWVSMGFKPFVYGNSILATLNIYYLGNKFIVLYDHLICFALLLMLYRGKNRKLWVSVISLASIILSFAFECSTTVVGAIAFFVLMMMEEFFKPFLRRKSVLSATLAVSAAFPFLSNEIMSIGLMQKIVTKFLSRTITLTGRVNIYNSVVRVVSINPLWGIGSGNSTAIIRGASGGANIQNGLWQIVITYGIVGAVLLVLILLKGMDIPKSFKLNFNSYTALVMAYVFILIGSVEITYGIQLLLFVAVCSVYFHPDKRKEKQLR